MPLETASGFALGVPYEIFTDHPNGSPPGDYYEIIHEDVVIGIHIKLLQEIRMKFFHELQFLNELLIQFPKELFQ